MEIGTVKFYNVTKGYGFITPDAAGRDVFVHATTIKAADMMPLREGDRVGFEIENAARGASAVQLRRV